MDHHFLLISILTSYLLIVTSASTTVAGSASESTSINDIRLNYIHCLLHRDNCTNLKQNVIELEQSGNLLDSKITVILLSTLQAHPFFFSTFAK